MENYRVYLAIMCRWAIFHTKLLDTSMNSESSLFLMVKAIFSQIPRYQDLGISTYFHTIPIRNRSYLRFPFAMAVKLEDKPI
jgi:hypothetical protein